MAEYIENFEFVWATIDEKFYDRDFRGLDWQAVHDRYLPQIVEAADGEAVFWLLNSMLWELGVSHIGVVPPDNPEELDPALTTRGELGIDVRLLDDEWVITHVAPGSAAADAGLLPGFALVSVDGTDMDEIADSGPPMPPRHDRGVRSSKILAVEGSLSAEPGVETTLGYYDAEDVLAHVTLTFREKTSKAQIDPNVPAFYPTIETSRLAGGLGYIRFDAFMPSLLDPLLQALDEMQDALGLIIDIRGNHGGVFDVRKGLVDRLVSSRELIWRYRGNWSEDVFATPAEVTYGGPVVILVDVVSASSAEEFSGALQAIDRAVVIGERTAGRVLVAEFAELPSGALMIYPVVESSLADGTVLEGHGVIPDIAVATTREDLLAGVDAPLKTAIDHILNG
ncbi:MAG: S41 family peptidase [Acidimicrobiia bacterium]|nr:S41 family peptidase [Acidimicrobiia bacterium]